MIRPITTALCSVLLLFAVQGSAQEAVPADSLSHESAPTLKPGALYQLIGDEPREMSLLPVEKEASSGLFGAALSAAAGDDIEADQFWAYLEGKGAELVLESPQPRFRASCPKVEAHKIRLGKFAVAGSKRRARIKAKGTVDYFESGYKIPLTMTEVGKDLWEFTPTKPLKPGEYGLALSSDGPVADFVVPKPPKQ